MASAARSYDEKRELPRDEVHYRAKAYDDNAIRVPLLVVNLSAQGLMARVDVDRQVGERLHIQLPVVGTVIAVVRWSLGGRIGCELERTIGMADYYELLAALLKQTR